MKTQKAKVTAKKSVRKDYTIKPSLQGKYDNQPLFQDKVNRANFILKKFGIPRFNEPKWLGTAHNNRGGQTLISRLPKAGTRLQNLYA